MLEKIIYLCIFIAYFAIVRALFIRAEYMSEKRKKREEGRRNARFYHTIKYDNFNVEKGVYENEN